MKFFAVIFVVVQAVLMQSVYSQVIRSAAPMAISSPIIAQPSAIIAQPSVANSLADTLSLLTVSSLLAESLPLNPNVIATVPVPMAAPACSPAISYGGCGCNRGYGNYYNYIY